MRDAPFVYVTGGCRSGKSAYAQALAERAAPKRLYVATLEARESDPEIAERIRLHRAARGPGWRVYEPRPGEAPQLAARLASVARPGEAVLFDCLSVWAAGCMQGDAMPPDFAALCDDLLRSLWRLPGPVIVVGSEVGFGLAPDNKAGRAFRDMAGLAGQAAAALASHALLVVSGLPLLLKGPEEQWLFPSAATAPSLRPGGKGI